MSSTPDRSVLTYIAANVRRLRLERGMTQEALSEAADVDLTSLQRIERADANPTVGMLAEIARALGVEPGALFGPATMPEIKRGRPRKQRRAPSSAEAAPQPPTAAPTGPSAPPASSGATTKRASRKASAPERASTGRKASSPGKTSKMGSAGRKRSQ